MLPKDTATAYGNEEAVGRAIHRCNVPREDLFITTKLWIPDISYEGAMRGFARSLERLGLDYLDMYVIHQPYHDYFGAWRALEELYKQGKIRAISIDNFTQDRLADFMFWNKIKPASNPQRMKENLNIFDFALTDAEMQDIAKLDRGHTCFMPRNTGKSVHDFLTQAVAGTAPSGIIEDATK